MFGVINTNMVELYDTKLDAVLKAVEILLVRTNHIKGFVSKVNNSYEARTL